MKTEYIVEEVVRRGSNVMYRCGSLEEARRHAERLARMAPIEVRVREVCERVMGVAWSSKDGAVRWRAE